MQKNRLWLKVIQSQFESNIDKGYTGQIKVIMNFNCGGITNVKFEKSEEMKLANLKDTY